MRLLTAAALVLALANGREICRTPDWRFGDCVLLTQCPHMLATLQNQTSSLSQDHVRQSHCGFQSIFMPKVCCPVEWVARPHSRCGMHTPEGEQDPWIALIAYEKANSRRGYFCGGVLIHKKYVLTAAHCVVGDSIPKDARIVGVRFGDSNTNPPMEVPVEAVMVHENYNQRHGRNDVALLRLRKKVTLKNGEIGPICLPTSNGADVQGHYQLAGWQRVVNESESFIKKAGIATVWSRDECLAWYNNTGFRLGDSHICAEGMKTPYLHKHGINVGGVLAEVGKDGSYSIVGIASTAPFCCLGGDNPKLYTGVGQYVNWIFNNLDI